jgi:tripartite-type tricarboxylate transporter receptor subunit TctC
MDRTARRALLSAPLLLSALGAARAQQQAWPARPVVLLVPWAPGGSNDLTARLLAPHLSERFGQSFVVENRPGGGGAVGMGQVARARPDGHTLLVSSRTRATIRARPCPPPPC